MGKKVRKRTTLICFYSNFYIFFHGIYFSTQKWGEALMGTDGAKHPPIPATHSWAMQLLEQNTLYFWVNWMEFTLHMCFHTI